MIYTVCFAREKLRWAAGLSFQQVAEHHRKQRKAARKNPTTGRKIKDPGIPNSLPFKEEVGGPPSVITGGNTLVFSDILIRFQSKRER